MIEITAPCCGQKILFILYELRESGTFTCPGCGTCIEITRTDEGLEVKAKWTELQKTFWLGRKRDYWPKHTCMPRFIHPSRVRK